MFFLPIYRCSLRKNGTMYFFHFYRYFARVYVESYVRAKYRGPLSGTYSGKKQNTLYISMIHNSLKNENYKITVTPLKSSFHELSNGASNSKKPDLLKSRFSIQPGLYGHEDWKTVCIDFFSHFTVILVTHTQKPTYASGTRVR